MDLDFEQLIDAALTAFFKRDPVTATFAGEHGFDHVLPRADAAAETEECAALAAFAERLAASPIPDTAGARLDARHLAVHCTLGRADFTRRTRYRNPAWYTGEAAFGLISLLLAEPTTAFAQPLRARLQAIAGYLDDGIARLEGVPIPAAWVARAHSELAALVRLIEHGLPLHPAGRLVTDDDARRTLTAAARFGTAIAAAEVADAACGTTHLAMVLERVHGIGETPAELERRAADAFAASLDTLEAKARTLDPAFTWREHIARLADIGSAGSDVVEPYRHWNERALHAGRELVTPASECALTYELLPDWAQPVAVDLYFLFYRSPPALGNAASSRYWVLPASGSAADIRRTHNTATVKLVHAVHHGSLGHHTQNARARAADSRFARIAGTDGASATALPAGGTLVEGWACYAETLMAEIPGFYTPAEDLLLAYFTLRHIAGTLADIRLHTGFYSLADMRAFYRDEVAFGPARLDSETTRNSMHPGSRAMYWCGTQQIAALRRASPLPAKAFHDALLGYGAAPVAAIADELARATF